MLLRVFLLAVACLGFGAGFVIHDAFAQTTDTFNLTLSGPTTARPGDEVVYILRHSYSTTAPPRQVPYFFDIPQRTTFVSVSDTSGTDFAEVLVGDESIAPSAPEFAARAVGQPNVQLTFIPSADNGQATIRVKIASGASGSIRAHARFGATGLGTSNEVVSRIESRHLPATGTGRATGTTRIFTSAFLVLLGIGLACGTLASVLHLAAPTRHRRAHVS